MFIFFFGCDGTFFLAALSLAVALGGQGAVAPSSPSPLLLSFIPMTNLAHIIHMVKLSRQASLTPITAIANSATVFAGPTNVLIIRNMVTANDITNPEAR
jgi:hypothetical protein